MEIPPSQLQQYILTKEKDRKDIEELFQYAFQSYDTFKQCLYGLEIIANKFENDIIEMKHKKQKEEEEEKKKQQIIEKKEEKNFFEIEKIEMFHIIDDFKEVQEEDNQQLNQQQDQEEIYDQEKVHQLMNQIDEFVHQQLKQYGLKLILVTDIYSQFNKSIQQQNNQMISPKQMKQACDLLNKEGKYCGIMELNSNLIFHLRDFTLEKFKRIIQITLQYSKKVSCIQISQHYGIQYPIVYSLLTELEKQQMIVKSESIDGILYYIKKE